MSEFAIKVLCPLENVHCVPSGQIGSSKDYHSVHHTDIEKVGLSIVIPCVYVHSYDIRSKLHALSVLYLVG